MCVRTIVTSGRRKWSLTEAERYENGERDATSDWCCGALKSSAGGPEVEHGDPRKKSPISKLSLKNHTSCRDDRRMKLEQDRDGRESGVEGDDNDGKERGGEDLMARE